MTAIDYAITALGLCAVLTGLLASTAPEETFDDAPILEEPDAVEYQPNHLRETA